MGLTIYTKTGCPYCQAAKKDFQEKGLAYTEINLSEFPGRIPEMQKLANTSKVPVIVDNGKVTVGFKGGS